MNQTTKIRNLQLINHVLLVAGVSWVVYTSQWYLLGISLFVGFIFCVFGINIALHRYITHQSFETYPIVEKILLTITVQVTQNIAVRFVVERGALISKNINRHT